MQTFPAPGQGSSGLAWNGTYIWNSDQITDMIYKIDSEHRKCNCFISSPGGIPMGLTFDGQYLWNSDDFTGQIYQLDAGYTAPLGPTPAHDWVVTILTMLGGMGGWAGVKRIARGE